MKRQPTFRQDVQGLRGVAVLVVVLFHAGLGFPGGFVGVDVFFVISGFVIGQGMLAELRASQRLDIKSFYSRRIRRLLPALSVMLVACTVLTIFIMSPAFPQPNALETARAANLSVSNLYLYIWGDGYFNPVAEGNPFVHTWSLGVEEQFYLGFPLLLAIVGWRWQRRAPRTSIGRRIGAAFALVGVVSFACAVAWSYDITFLARVVPEAPRFAFYGPISRVWEFLVGALLALTLVRRPRLTRPRAIAAAMGLGGLGLIALTSFLYSSTTTFPGLAATIPVGGTALVIAAGAGPAASLLATRPLVWLGDRSYSWYLWHWPLIVLVPVAVPSLRHGAVVGALLSLVPAVLSYRFIEQRFRVRRGAIRTTGAVRLALVSVLVPMVTIGLALAGSRRNWGLDIAAEFGQASISKERRCWDSGTPLPECTFPASASRQGIIMLVGDSHADVISDAVVGAGTAAGYDVVVQSALGCPFVSEVLAFESECVARQQQTLSTIRDLQPSLLVIANNSAHALGMLDPGAGSPSAATLARWEQAMQQTFADVAPLVDAAILFSTVPYFTPAEFDGTLPTLLRPSGGNVTMSIDEAERQREPIAEVERDAAENAPIPATFVDSMPPLCGSGGCPIRDANGRYRYSDPNHLTTYGAEYVEPLLTTAIERSLAEIGEAPSS